MIMGFLPLMMYMMQQQQLSTQNCQNITTSTNNCTQAVVNSANPLNGAGAYGATGATAALGGPSAAVSAAASGAASGASIGVNEQNFNQWWQMATSPPQPANCPGNIQALANCVYHAQYVAKYGHDCGWTPQSAGAGVLVYGNAALCNGGNSQACMPPPCPGSVQPLTAANAAAAQQNNNTAFLGKSARPVNNNRDKPGSPPACGSRERSFRVSWREPF